jgi:cysteine desulfurase
MRAYLDHAATSPMSEAVTAAYVEALSEVGNSASTHAHGQAASDRLERARASIAATLGCDPALVTFTGGGTESINLAIKGLFWAAQKSATAPTRNVVMLAEGEHHATIEAAEWLRDSQGAELRFVPLDDEGTLQPEVLRTAITEVGAERIALVSFLWANNEVGTVQPVQALTRVARDAAVPVHIDAVAALGQLPIDFDSVGADALSLSAHKIGGPVGVGALLLARHLTIEPLLHGGSQQRARSGTQNVAGAVAFAAALDQAYGDDFAENIAQLTALRDRLITEVTATVPDAQLRGSRTDRLASNAHFTFAGCQGDSLVFLLDAANVSASVGSACQAGVAEVSHVLLAMGVPEHEAIGSLRFTLSTRTTWAEIEMLLAALPDAVKRAQAAGLS